jgi:(1->4)-alpha-D-glucan 1-alpha-D-glucosylmutase
MEDPRVFAATHGRILALIGDGLVTGLRIDHPDGLLDPATYFADLLRAIDALPGRPTSPDEPFYIVAEKILGCGELIPEDWLIAGTTGYGFLNTVNGLFVDASNEDAIRSLYALATGRATPFEDIAAESKRLVMHSALASELGVLAIRLKAIARADRRTRDLR